jgi:hypothetical protein
LKRNLTWWVSLLVVLIGLSLGVGAATYDSVDELPEPDLVVTDQSGDAQYWFTAIDAPRGWYDIREVQAFITGDGIAVAVTCNGSPSSDDLLVVLIDVDGSARSVGMGEPYLVKFARAGYDYALGHVGRETGIFTASAGMRWTRNPNLEWWREGQVAYFEVTWDQIGGRPEAVTICAYIDDFALAVSDIAPNRGKATLEIPAASSVVQTAASPTPDSASEATTPATASTATTPGAASVAASSTGWMESFNSASLSSDWWWVRENPVNWILSNGFLRVTGDLGSLYGELDNATNLLLRDVSAGDFEVETYVEFEPRDDFQMAGLLIYGDDSNFMLLGPAHCGICGGIKVFFEYEENGQVMSSGQGLDFPQQGYAYLKVTRQGSTYTGYYSANGNTWVQVAQYNNVNIHPRGVGIATTGSTVPNPPTAAFDYVQLTE